MTSLKDLPTGTMGEIIEVHNERLMDRFGSQVGMTAMVLAHAVQSIIQIGTQQFEVSPDVLGQIIVKEI